MKSIQVAKEMIAENELKIADLREKLDNTKDPSTEMNIVLNIMGLVRANKDLQEFIEGLEK